MSVKVSFRVGNRRGIVNQSDSYAQDAFIDALGAEVAQKASNNVEVDVVRLQRVLDTRIKNSLRQAVNFAAMNLMGVKSNINTQARADPTKIVFNMTNDGDLPLVNPSANAASYLDNPFDLQWSALSRRTIMKKSSNPAAGKSMKGTSPREEARRFFIHTGGLQREIKSLANSVVNQTGTVKIAYIKGQGKTFRPLNNKSRVKVGQLQLRFLPKMPIRNLKGFLYEDPGEVDPKMLFERSLGLSPTSLKKLEGVEGYQRPLLQPVFSYWMLSRIPRLVSVAISNAIRAN